MLTVQCCDYDPGHAQYCAVIPLCAIIRLCGYVTSLPGHVGRYECTWPVAECIVIGMLQKTDFGILNDVVYCTVWYRVTVLCVYTFGNCSCVIGWEGITYKLLSRV